MPLLFPRPNCPISHPPLQGGGASAIALAGGGLTLLIYRTPREFAIATSHPPTSAEGENFIGFAIPADWILQAEQ